MKDKVGVSDQIGFQLNGKPIQPKQNQLICPKCGIDRLKQLCPGGVSAVLTGHCPMIAKAQ